MYLPTKKNNALPWSYSKLSCWESCRKQYKYRYIMRIPSTPGPSAQRGINAHEAFEKYFSGQIDKQTFYSALYRNKSSFNGRVEAYVNSLAAQRVQQPEIFLTEIKLKVDENFNPIDGGEKHYATFIYDLLVDTDKPEIIDWKTGKVYVDTHEFQAAIYAYAAYCLMGKIPTITYVYLDQDYIANYNFTAEELGQVDDVINTYLKQIDDEEEFPQCADMSKCHFCSYKGICRGIGSKVK